MKYALDLSTSHRHGREVRLYMLTTASCIVTKADDIS